MSEILGLGDMSEELSPRAYMGATKSLRRASTVEQLRYKKQHLEEELKKVNDAIEVLDKNPELQNALHLISLALG